jgi:hypothetical protein
MDVRAPQASGERERLQRPGTLGWCSAWKAAVTVGDGLRRSRKRRYGWREGKTRQDQFSSVARNTQPHHVRRVAEASINWGKIFGEGTSDEEDDTHGTRALVSGEKEL